MYVPFIHAYRGPTGAEIASHVFAKFIHWKTRDIVHVEEKRVRLALQGAIVRNAYLKDPFLYPQIMCAGERPAVTSVEYYIAEAQEVRYVKVYTVAEHHYNRQSGRYLFSDVKREFDDGTRRDRVEYWQLPRLSRTEILEARR